MQDLSLQDNPAKAPRAPKAPKEPKAPKAPQGEGKKEVKKDTKLGLATSKADNFSEWYTELVRRSGGEAAVGE